MSAEPCVLILAAGQGRRFRQASATAQDKLLAPCRGLDGVTRGVLQQVLCNLPAHLTRRLLVTTPQRTEVVQLAQQHGCQVLLLASTGLGQSLAAAVEASREAGAWLVVLADMPFIAPATYQQVLDGLAHASVSRAQWQGRAGHPVAFASRHGQALMALSGDVGAKGLLRNEQVHDVAVADPGVLWDVDEPAALDFQPGLLAPLK
ncbi:NTP transferase domain-containing protein [Pseudomonas sp. 5P_3.1_Bac2]|uniref:nucleotidyltransferase family protein n=1 Tax=Pseudomonas sp. 5P_3.1_Bac2 TaxID=2971617 RepID=UPI0021CA90E4|nr:nucleotidyltransferase family protein [Pseudomonas sp. 5P_3.1_Bac2]MCU1716613.1 nucleotidyltransferase family protein [Pseudomonas sp. 5P_3.1_Bac2]